MKRHILLQPLSQDHHHTLALCVRVLRAPECNHQAEIEPHLIDLEQHFQQEEQQFAPLWQYLPDDCLPLKQRFEQEHAQLRALFAAAQFDDENWNKTFATSVRDHARFEERELFPALEKYALNQADNL
ncbi:MAG: hemerythrin domain-containing protein [Neisseria sp.]|nr:hemerythrin domain-containing protein [Neisseria sp.]